MMGPMVGCGLSVVAWALAATSGCDAGIGARSRRDPGALVVARATDIRGLDPLRVTDSESIEVGGLVFEGLLRWRPGTTEVEPGLATQWSVSGDGNRWTFVLRDGVRFHDGTVLDARAVVFSFERLLVPAHPAYLDGPDAAYRRGLLKSVTRIVAVDSRTIEVHTATPYAPLLGDLAMYPIVSPAAVTRWGDEFPQHPVGTGPYRLESWDRGEQVVLQRNDDYWGDAPSIGRIVFRVVIDARQRLVELESGSVDIAGAVLPDEQPFVELHPELMLVTAAGNDVSYLALNMQRPWFRDVRVRQAINHAINKQPIVKLAYQGRAIPAEGPLPPSSWAYQPPTRIYPYDLASARELLAAATAAGTFQPDVELNFYALSTPRPYLSQPDRAARFIQSALAQVGIKTRLTLLPYEEHNTIVEAGYHDLALFGWVGDTGDPDNFLNVLFHSHNAKQREAQNIAFFEDPEVDRALDAAQRATDKATRTALYATVQSRILELAPWVPIAHSEFVVAARAGLENVVLSPLGHPVYPLIRRGAARD